MKRVPFVIIIFCLLWTSCTTTIPVENPQPIRTGLLVGFVKLFIIKSGEFYIDFETMEGEIYKLCSPGYETEGIDTKVNGPNSMLGLTGYFLEATFHQLPIYLIIVEEYGIIQEVMVDLGNELLVWELVAEEKPWITRLV